MGKWIPRLYDTLMGPLERRFIREIRKQLLKKANGHVLEIGSGTGFNFPFYQDAEHVVAIEPNPAMAQKSRERIQMAPCSLEVIEAGAEQLPFPDNTFDTIVGTLVFCSIPDPLSALREIRRVSKPDARILLFEHVRMQQPFLARVQDWLTPAWKRVCDGCHLNRDTLELVRQEGFTVIRVHGFYRDLFLVIEVVANKEQ
ncbi:MAG: class I SAM-dependent methyltransferase [Clostridia bacterium]